MPSPPSSVSLLSAPVSTSSPPSPLSPALASSVFFASTVIASLPSPPLTITVNVPSAGTVWSPSVRAVPVRAAVEPAGRLAVHQQAAGHRHRDVVVGAVEVERRGQSVDRRRADRRLRGSRRCGEACGQRCSRARPEWLFVFMSVPPLGHEFVIEPRSSKAGTVVRTVETPLTFRHPHRQACCSSRLRLEASGASSCSALGS